MFSGLSTSVDNPEVENPDIYRLWHQTVTSDTRFVHRSVQWHLVAFSVYASSAAQQMQKLALTDDTEACMGTWSRWTWYWLLNQCMFFYWPSVWKPVWQPGGCGECATVWSAVSQIRLQFASQSNLPSHCPRYGDQAAFKLWYKFSFIVQHLSVLFPDIISQMV